MSNNILYRIVFIHVDDVYEIYSRKVTESDMFGFVLVEDFVFGETTTLVVDPSEERLKLEFANIKRTYIPMQSILRIDEVDKQGSAKIRDRSGSSADKVTLFPVPGKPK